MSVHSLVPGSDPILHRPAPWIWPQRMTQEVIADCIDTMRHHKAKGLAAPQIGFDARICVIEHPGFPPLVLVNPRLRLTGRIRPGLEGCLSFPEQRVAIHRSDECFVAASNIPKAMRATGLFARAIQHEVDHLDGITILERAEKEDTMRRP